jgi:predicted phage terminase large subunit-like protein
MAWQLQQCIIGDLKRLIIAVPPRSLKSICASVAFPAWVLGNNPSQRIICASYSSDLASKHARDCRTIMESGWYQGAFPNTRLSDEKNTETYFVTTKQGYRYATSVGGSLTGFGGNIIIIDDLLKPDDALSDTKRAAVDDWFNGTLYSRSDDKRDGVIILIMQRLHIDDLVGHVLQQERWVQLKLPAIAEEQERIEIGEHEIHTRQVGDLLHPERESTRELDRMKVVLGSQNFSAQYQQNPVPLEGGLIKWSWFQPYDRIPETIDSVIQSWDTAAKPGESNDYSVCTTWLTDGNHYYLKDILRQRLNCPDLKKMLINHALLHQADTIIIEDTGSGTALIQELQQDRGLRTPVPIGFKPKGDKLTRMCAQSAKIEAGQVLIPVTAGWLGEFQTEVLRFPRGRHDDQIDSMSQFLAWQSEREKRGIFKYWFIDPY